MQCILDGLLLFYGPPSGIPGIREKSSAAIDLAHSGDEGVLPVPWEKTDGLGIGRSAGSRYHAN